MYFACRQMELWRKEEMLGDVADDAVVNVTLH
jgi:hypothetical protein